jgi:hypothetical protein
MDRASDDTYSIYAFSSVDDQRMPDEEAMHISLVLDDGLLATAQDDTGIKENSALVRRR